MAETDAYRNQGIIITGTLDLVLYLVETTISILEAEYFDKKHAGFSSSGVKVHKDYVDNLVKNRDKKHYNGWTRDQINMSAYVIENTLRDIATAALGLRGVISWSTVSLTTNGLIRVAGDSYVNNTVKKEEIITPTLKIDSIFWGIKVGKMAFSMTRDALDLAGDISNAVKGQKEKEKEKADEKSKQDKKDNTVATPTADPASGAKLLPSTNIVLKCETEGAKIYYTFTTDGKEPSDPAKSGALLYADFIKMPPAADLRVFAIAKKDKMDNSEQLKLKYLRR
jgi:hypothetical protein